MVARDPLALIRNFVEPRALVVFALFELRLAVLEGNGLIRLAHVAVCLQAPLRRFKERAHALPGTAQEFVAILDGLLFGRVVPLPKVLPTGLHVRDSSWSPA